jgi:hypothetical protein
MDFHEDNAWQRDVRDRILAPQFYGKYAMQGRFIFLDKGEFATLLQKRHAVDTLLQSRRDGAVVPIEEKIVRWPRWGSAHTCFALEKDSCTVPGHESNGWMHYSLAEFLFYCFMQEDQRSLDCYLIDFPKLKTWFWDHCEDFDRFCPLNTSNRTMGRKVPISLVQQAIPTHRLFLTEPDELPSVIQPEPPKPIDPLVVAASPKKRQRKPAADQLFFDLSEPPSGPRPISDIIPGIVIRTLDRRRTD